MREDSFPPDEGLIEYGSGGYYPVFLGDVLHNRYKVLCKIGTGHFSTVYRCADTKADNRIVALKIQKAAKKYRVAARDEVSFLQIVNKARAETPVDADNQDYVLTLLDTFEIEGQNGSGVHVVMVLEYLGHSVLTLIKRYHYRGCPVAVVQHIMRQLLQGLAFMHTKCNLIHTDIKPENLLFVSPPRSSRNSSYTDTRSMLSAYEFVNLAEDLSVLQTAPYSCLPRRDKVRVDEVAQRAFEDAEDEGDTQGMTSYMDLIKRAGEGLAPDAVTAMTLPPEMERGGVREGGDIKDRDGNVLKICPTGEGDPVPFDPQQYECRLVDL
ncbi:hypothetical protein KIPB_009720, partial [Kipferlia bialata]|eukprot:g9720.t1